MAREKGQMIAQGRTAEVFAWGDKQVLKLFLEGWPIGDAEREARSTQAVYDAGLPAPVVEGVVEVDGRKGIVFERVEGPSMLKELTAKPWKVVKLARVLAELHAAMHSREIPELPSLRGAVQESIRDSVLLAEATKEAALKVLEQLPDGNAVCHGDYHPDQVIMSSRVPIIIDWNRAVQGNPLADVARTSFLLQMGDVPSFVAGRWLIKAIRAWFHSIYLKRYLRLRPASREEIAAWELLSAAVRLADEIPEEKDQLLALIEARLKVQG